jgi:hypothetical protein
MVNGFPELVYEDRKEDIEEVLEALPHDHTALQLGQALYRCRSLSWRERWYIGKHILQFESPKLGVIAQVNPQDFATLLDQRIRRMEQLEANNGTPQQIDQPIERPQIEPSPRPMARTLDRRYRRL